MGWSQAAIFSGGNGDGAATNCFATPVINVYGLYTGGNGDGVDLGCLLQNDSIILAMYGGGIQDGTQFNCFIEQLASPVAFYFGGTDDGTGYNCYLQPTINATDFLYFGGAEDGASYNCYFQASQLAAGIYNGGIGDGFGTYCFDQTFPTTPVVFSLYSGGYSDGADVYCHLQQTPVGSEQMFAGGVDDGYSVDCHFQMIPVGNSLFGGGIDDGSTVNCHFQIIPTGYSPFGGGVNDGFDVNCFLQTDFLSVVLPIELTYFSAELNNERTIDLTWETATEYNNDYFILERSTNLFDWEEIAEIDGAGTSTEPLEYYHEDTAPYIGDNYYRLIQVDFNGDFNISQIVSVNLDGSTENVPQLLIYPNPVTDLFNIQMSDYEPGEYSIEIYNDLGQVIYQKTIFISNDTEIYQVNREPSMISGFYILLTNSKETEERQSEKIMFK